MEFNITGICAEGKKNYQTFASLRPVGAVKLVHEKDNEYDPYCISVWYEGVKLGYVPANKVDGKYIGSELQRTIINEGIEVAHIEGFSYRDGDSFNDDCAGVLGSVTLSLEMPENDSGRIVGGKYMRVTKFISYFDYYGGGDGLIKWAYEQASDYEGYRAALKETAVNGTLMHDAIEAELRGNATKETRKHLPDGWAAFVKKYKLEPCYMEERFYDNTLMVTGQPDLVGYCNGELMVIDWKSSKKPNKKHEIQASIYAKNAQWEGEAVKGAMVVAFGSDNRQGFATTTIKPDKIENYYEAMKLLRQMMTLSGVYVRNYWEGD